MMILTPDDIEYHTTLANIPAYWQVLTQKTQDFMGWIYRDDGFVPDCVTQTEMLDYMLGGEYEERLNQSGYDLDENIDLSGVYEVQIDW